MPHIVSLVYKPAIVEQKPADHFARVPLEQAMLVVGKGIAGDAKGRNEDRQLNLMLAELVADLRAGGFQTAPGELGEQIVLAGLEPGSLIAGARLRLGDSAIVEIDKPRTGCDRFEHIQGRPKETVNGKLGFMARVVAGGEIAVGDPVRLESPAKV